MSEPDWRTRFEETYSGPPSAVAEAVWREVFGDEYPAGLDPYSFVTVSELNRFSAELRVAEGDRLADLGCGRGGAGLWVAGKTGAQLIGIDISETALQAARSRASAMGVEHLAEFREGSFERTGLGSAFLDGVMSVDALLFAPDKAAALTELRRILRPNGRLVFTSWDYGRQPEKRPPQVDDHRPHLRAAGFDVLAYDETEDWHRRTLESGQGLLDHVEELALESGDDVGELRASIGEMLATVDAMTRRVLVVASAA